MNRTNRRGSMGDSGDHSGPADDKSLKCPKCKQFYQSPKIMPCGHRLCKNCIDYLQKRSADGKLFHCPQPSCGQVCATTAEALRSDFDLERAASNRRRSQGPRVPARCRVTGCNRTDVVCTRCPHCDLPLCGDHFVDHSKIVTENCYRQKEKMEALEWQLRGRLDDCKLHKTSVDNLIHDNEDTHKQLINCLNDQFCERSLALQRSKKGIEEKEEEINELFEKIQDVKCAIDEALRFDDDDQESLQAKQQVVNESRLLADNMKLPKLPDDVRFNHTPSDVETITNKIKELKVLQESLEVATVASGKLTIKCPDPVSRPHHAVLWRPTENFYVNAEGHVQRWRAAAEGTRNTAAPILPDEVLLMTNMMKLVVLSLEGRTLGTIKATGSAPLVVNWFDVSPDGRLLALLSTNERKVLLCDMDGSVRAAICPDVLPGIHSLCSVALDSRWLMIVDPGNTSHKRAGCVCLLDAPNFDPQRARHIPLNKRRIFPTAVTSARGNFYVLANKASSEAETDLNELLAHDQDFQFISDVGPESLRTALQVCSDSSGRIFVSVTRSRRTLSEARQTAEILVLDPLGRRIGSVSDPGMASCHGVSHSERQRGRPARLVVCDPDNNLVHVYQMAE